MEFILSMTKPIEYWRLWVIEIVFVGAPAVFFVLYAKEETARVKIEQEKNAALKKSIEEESDYYDGRKYYTKLTKGKWLSENKLILGEYDIPNTCDSYP